MSEFEELKVKRIIEFDDNVEETTLKFRDGNETYEFAEEYPIVRYESDEDYGVEQSEKLNMFIKSITVSTGCNGKYCYNEDGKPQEEIIDMATVIYYTDNFGENHEIIQNDIAMFLIKKPKLVVSAEGLLVFYTKKQILVTLDCIHYLWVDNIYVEAGWEITQIIPKKNSCTVVIEFIKRTVFDEDLFDSKKEVRIEFKINASIYSLIEFDIL